MIQGNVPGAGIGFETNIGERQGGRERKMDIKERKLQSFPPVTADAFLGASGFWTLARGVLLRLVSVSQHLFRKAWRNQRGQNSSSERIWTPVSIRAVPLLYPDVSILHHVPNTDNLLGMNVEGVVGDGGGGKEGVGNISCQ